MNCQKGSLITEHASCTPRYRLTCSTSPGFVAGVIRSTIEFGNDTLASIQFASSLSHEEANVINAFLAISPLPNILSQDNIEMGRSEERRVGKECRCGWWRGAKRKKGEIEDGQGRMTEDEDSVG